MHIYICTCIGIGTKWIFILSHIHLKFSFRNACLLFFLQMQFACFLSSAFTFLHPSLKKISSLTKTASPQTPSATTLHHSHKTLDYTTPPASSPKVANLAKCQTFAHGPKSISPLADSLTQPEPSTGYSAAAIWVLACPGFHPDRAQLSFGTVFLKRS